MNHTPGPWEAAPLTISYGSQSIQEDYAINAPDRWYGLAKVPVTVDGEPSEEGLANARLIAAAPELYGATCALLEQLRSLCRRGIISEFELAEGLGSDIDTAQAAIAKAKEGA